MVDQRLEKRMARVLQHLSWSKDDDVEISVLGGGLTNHVFLVRRHPGVYTLRVFDPSSRHFVDRSSEIECHTAFCPLGIAPGVVASDAEHSFLMTEHVEGRCLTHGEYIHGEVLPLVTTNMRILHQSGKLITRVFEPLPAANILFEQALQAGSLAVNRQRLTRLFDGVKKLLANVDLAPCRFVPCHLDLVPGNVILSPTADGLMRVTFIDWEYAAMAPVELEFANIFTELNSDTATELRLLRHYLQGGDPIRLYNRIRPFRCFAAFYWLLWSLIQDRETSLAGNYQCFALRYLEQAERFLPSTCSS